MLLKWAICTAVAASAIGGTSRADVVFADTEFAPSSWGFEQVLLGPGGSSAPSQVGGGNPGNARQLVNTINAGGAASVFGFSRYGTTTGTRFDPVTQGAIGSVDWSIDSRWLAGGGGQGHSITLGVKQGVVVYYADYDITGSSGLWSTHGALGLTAADFAPLTTGPAIDFSATGAPIRFGFIVGNSGDTPYFNTVMYDNFSVTVHTIPGPGVGGMAGCILGAFAARRRR